MIIWIASYPRSGNTFLRILLHQNFGIESYSLYGDAKSIQADEATRTVVGHRLFDNEFDEAACRVSADCYFIKTHEPWEGRFANDRAIYVVRDGRDALLSYWHFYQDYWGVEIAMADLIDGKCFAGRWCDHVVSWKPDERDNVLLLRFEELVSNPGRTIHKISNFVGMAPKTTEAPTFEELNAMNSRFFRQGQYTGGDGALGVENRDRFWALHGDAMQRFGYDR